jgi:hypothetical protein
MDKDTFILEMGYDFINFAGLLEKEEILKPIATTLYKVGGKLKSKDSIEYEFDPIMIEFDDSEKFPKKLSHKQSAMDLKLHFNIELKIDNDRFRAGNDPFRDFEFNIIIKGINKNNQNSKLYYAIHFDRHDLDEEKKAIEENKAKKPIQPHPAYHFQFGGNKLHEQELDYGQALFLDSPRIMHHPMDLILGIDFILSNFFPSIWDKIKGERQYKKILQKYQQHFIQPYFQSIANSFDSSLPQKWNAQEIYPQLIR